MRMLEKNATDLIPQKLNIFQIKFFAKNKKFWMGNLHVQTDEYIFSY